MVAEYPARLFRHSTNCDRLGHSGYKAACADRMRRPYAAPANPVLANAALAALAPGAPWTAPPGCAEALAKYNRSIGVSARPSPGTGRKISCWCRAAV